jgi:putative transcriptional regulator
MAVTAFWMVYLIMNRRALHHRLFYANFNQPKSETQGGKCVRISYNKLWHLMLDKKMNKADLRRATGVSTATIAKLDKGENITTDILIKICKALDCELNDIMELSRDK